MSVDGVSLVSWFYREFGLRDELCFEGLLAPRFGRWTGIERIDAIVSIVVLSRRVSPTVCWCEAIKGNRSCSSEV